MLETPAPPGALSPRAYGAHRKAKGLAGTALLAVQQAIKAGRLDRSIALDHKGHPKIVDAELADREWAANTKHGHKPFAVQVAEAVATGASPAPRTRARPAPEPGDDDGPRDDDGMPLTPDGEIDYSRLNVADAGRLKTVWQARQEELKYRKTVGELIEVAEVERGWQNVIGLSRTKLLAVPSKLKARRPHFTAEDVAAIEAEIREALDELASMGAHDDDEE
jgi:hypothetical protein